MNDDQTAKQSKKDALKGTGRRPRFNALWYLPELRVVKDLNDFNGAWKKAESGPRVTVAIIDTMPAFTHPNLVEAIDFGGMRDFTTSFEGEKVDENARHHAFGAHGTAVVGLIAARPVAGVKLRIPPYYEGTKKGENHHPDIALPYCGVNPFAKIVPIVVSAAPEPAMVVAALKHAARIDPAVVVIADSWKDAGGRRNTRGADGATTGDDIPLGYGSVVPGPGGGWTQSRVSWADASRALLELCTKAYVFCAAGNEPRTGLVYPASLSTPETGPWAVGACDINGNDLSYTPPSDAVRHADHRLITTLSSQHPRLDEVVQMLDPWAKTDEELGLPERLFDDSFQPFDIVTTDVPGPGGYNPSPYDHIPAKNDEHLEIASLFCRFSGTSAATALAAGLVSLAIAIDGRGKPSHSGPYKGPGHDAKELFTLEQAQALVAAGLPTKPPA